MTVTTEPLSVEHGLELAGDLIRALTPLSGDKDAIDGELNKWVDVLGPRDLALVCIAAVHTVFVDCLTLTPLEQLPADRLALLPTLPTERTPA